MPVQQGLNKDNHCMVQLAKPGGQLFRLTPNSVMTSRKSSLLVSKQYNKRFRFR